MTYEDIVWKVRGVYEYADAREVFEHIAVQVNITGPGAGILYIEIANRQVCVEPYDYHDWDGLVKVDGQVITDIADGKITLKEAFDKGLVTIEGNMEKLELLRKVKRRLPKKEDKLTSDTI